MGDEDLPPHGNLSPGQLLYIYRGTQIYMNPKGAIRLDSGEPYTPGGVKA